MILKNKKAGFKLVTEHVIKLIFAVLAIGILIFLAVKLWGTFTTDTDLEKAEANLNLIIEKSNALKGSDKTEDTLIIFPIEEWFLRSYYIPEQGHPSGECVGDKSCLCMFEEEIEETDCGSFENEKKGDLEYFYCENEKIKGKKVCKGVNFDLRVSEDYEIAQRVWNIWYVKNMFKFEKAQEELKIFKEENTIKIKKS